MARELRTHPTSSVSTTWLAQLSSDRPDGNLGQGRRYSSHYWPRREIWTKSYFGTWNQQDFSGFKESHFRYCTSLQEQDQSSDLTTRPLVVLGISHKEVATTALPISQIIHYKSPKYLAYKPGSFYSGQNNNNLSGLEKDPSRTDLTGINRRLHCLPTTVMAPAWPGRYLTSQPHTAALWSCQLHWGCRSY